MGDEGLVLRNGLKQLVWDGLPSVGDPAVVKDPRCSLA